MATVRMFQCNCCKKLEELPLLAREIGKSNGHSWHVVTSMQEALSYQVHACSRECAQQIDFDDQQVGSKENG